MKKRIATITGIGVTLTLALPARPHAADALLIELERDTLASGVSATNYVVVGGFDGCGSFYGMPTRNVIFSGGLVRRA